jgi:hypothetical protein
MKQFVFNCDKQVGHLARLADLVSEAISGTGVLDETKCKFKHVDRDNLLTSLPVGSRIANMALLTDVPLHEVERWLNLLCEV